MPRQPSRGSSGTPSKAPRFAGKAIAIFAIAFAIRLIHIWTIRESPYFAVLMGDSKAYDEWARRLAAGDWIGTGVFYQAPLYPYFLGCIYALFGHDLLLVRIVQAALGSAAAVLLALAARRFFSTDPIGLAAGLMLGLYAPAIFFDGLLQKATLDIFLMCASLWLLSERRWLALGVAMGALSITRENALLLVAVVAIACGVRRSFSFRPTATFLLGVALVLFPVALRNYAVGGGFYLTTSQFGPNFYLGNNPYTDGTAASLRGGRGAAEFERDDAVELAETATGRTLTPAEVSEYWTGLALDYIRSQPGDWLRLMARKFALLWNATEMLDTESQESYSDWSWPVRWGARIGHFGVLVPLAALGVALTWRHRSRLWVLYALIAAYAASVVMFFIYARYRYPLVPLLILFAAAAVAGVASFVRTHPRRQIAAAAALVVAVAALTNWPALSPEFMRAITDHNLGAELQSRGRIDEALVQYRRALAAKPDYAPAYNNLGTALAARGDAAGAREHYERALALQPDYANAHYNLGNALLQAGQPARAAVHFGRSLELGPGSADVHNNLGIALAESGDIDGAIVQFRRALRFDPDSARTRRNLSSLLLSRGALDEAISELSAAARATPGDAELHNDLGTALAAAGRFAEAAASYERALAMAPGFTEAQRNLAAVRNELAKRK